MSDNAEEDGGGDPCTGQGNGGAGGRGPNKVKSSLSLSPKDPEDPAAPNPKSKSFGKLLSALELEAVAPGLRV